MIHSPSIRESAVSLCEAIKRHARLCETAPDDTGAIEEATAEIAKAVTEYAASVFRKEGFPIFFDMPSEDPPEWRKKDTGSARDPIAETEELIIDDRFTVHIDDPAALGRFAESVTNRRVHDSLDALRALCGKDGWKPESYPAGLITPSYHSVECI